MSNRSVLISKERVYVSPDGARRVEDGETAPRKLLVGKGGEIEATVARFYGVETEEALSVSVVTPAVEEEYNRVKRVGEDNPEKLLREKILDEIDPKSLGQGAGVSSQVSTMTDGIINRVKTDEPGLDHTTPIPAVGADEIEAELEEKAGTETGKTGAEGKETKTGEGDQTGQAQTIAPNTRNKVIGNKEPETGDKSPGEVIKEGEKAQENN